MLFRIILLIVATTEGAGGRAEAGGPETLERRARHWAREVQGPGAGELQTQEGLPAKYRPKLWRAWTHLEDTGGTPGPGSQTPISPHTHTVRQHFGYDDDELQELEGDDNRAELKRCELAFLKWVLSSGQGEIDTESLWMETINAFRATPTPGRETV